MRKWRSHLLHFHHSEFIIHNCVVLALCATASADVLILNDGTRLEGKMHKEGDDWAIVDAAGKETDVPPDQIASFQLGGDSATQTPDTKLASLRKSADHLTDLHVIIDRYNTFIQANPATNAATQAQLDLATWQQRLDGQCVKVGSQWLTPAQRDALTATEADSAARIGDMIHQERMQDAADLLKQALADDPQNPSALYLSGVVLADQNQIVPARTAFEQSNKILPNHAATLNNLAVMLWKQHAYPAALLDYALAMTADPGNVTIVDNVAEALHALPPENRDNPPTVKAAALFDQQEKQVEQSQQAAGLERWGATWVKPEQLPALQAEQAEDDGDRQKMIDEIKQTQQSIADDDNQIASDQQLMSQLNSQNNTVMSGGNTRTLPVLLPPQYYQAQSDAAVFTQSKQISMEKLNHLLERATHLQTHLTTPKFTGVQQLFGPEGTPIRVEAVTTQPAN